MYVDLYCNCRTLDRNGDLLRFKCYGCFTRFERNNHFGWIYGITWTTECWLVGPWCELQQWDGITNWQAGSKCDLYMIQNWLLLRIHLFCNIAYTPTRNQRCIFLHSTLKSVDILQLYLQWTKAMWLKAFCSASPKYIKCLGAPWKLHVCTKLEVNQLSGLYRHAPKRHVWPYNRVREQTDINSIPPLPCDSINCGQYRAFRAVVV